MSIPSWYELVLLALAAFRLWRLLAEDDILDRPRRYVTALPRAWKPNDPLSTNYRNGLAAFISCPWCLGFWVVLALWGAWEVWPHAVLVVSAPLAVSALVGFLGSIPSAE